ncbi:spondin domain-containing protein [Massilia antarctica]|uniref:Spondin domain-containing protein n=2 Tax=Massilia antarctica TaxID=2765360 RepID=A0AA48WAI1_9BURK|nr:spondin domain-containing protein [Massilia antarctica]QPI48852.1 spondin domain-containing protein [Massilia antarctica]
MHAFLTNRFRLSSLVLALSLLASACGSGHADPDPAPAQPGPTTAVFEVTLVNLTAGQPFSPLLVIAHTDAFSLFKEGEAASVALENIAEAGNTAPLAALIGDAKSVIASATGPAAGPGKATTVSLAVPLAAIVTTRLSFAVMLGNTNDGFTGLSGESLASIPVAGSRSVDLIGYDAGTEGNTESADTVPGPATAGSGARREAFSALRDDTVGTVHVHPGIASKDDGLPTSALTVAQRWDNPLARLTIRRTQ